MSEALRGAYEAEREAEGAGDGGDGGDRMALHDRLRGDGELLTGQAIEDIADDLRLRHPGLRVLVAHGKLSPLELDTVMVRTIGFFVCFCVCVRVCVCACEKRSPRLGARAARALGVSR